jgi:hypothetical protein
LRLARVKTIFVDKTRKKGRVQVPADPPTVRKLVKPLVKRFLYQGAVNVIEPRKASVPRPKFNQFASGSFELVAQDAHEQASATNLGASAVLTLPRLIGQFLGLNRCPATDNTVGKLAMTASALCSQTPLAFLALERKLLVTLRSIDRLGALLPCPISVEALRVRGATGAIHAPLEAAQLLPRLLDRRAELLEGGFTVAHNRNVAWPDVEADDARSGDPTQRCVAFLHKLTVPTRLTVDSAADDAAVLGWSLQRLDLPRIAGVKDGRDNAIGKTNSAISPDYG